MPDADFDRYLAQIVVRYPSQPASLLRRLARAYGTDTAELLGEAATPGDLGEDFGAGLHAREIDFLCEREWARTGDDILFRRSKLGLHVPAGTIERIDAYLAQRRGAAN